MLMVTGCQLLLWELSRRSHRGLAAAFWALMGLAILTKAPAAPAMIVTMAAASWWWRGSRPWPGWRRLQPWWGLSRFAWRLRPPGSLPFSSIRAGSTRRSVSARFTMSFAAGFDEGDRGACRISGLLPDDFGSLIAFLPLVGDCAGGPRRGLAEAQGEPGLRLLARLGNRPAGVPRDRSHEADPLLPAGVSRSGFAGRLGLGDGGRGGCRRLEAVAAAADRPRGRSASWGC